jgi:large subunit ribosomal protein L1
MHQLSRRQKNNRQKIENQPYLDIEQAVKVIKETATAKFNETVEFHVNLNIDPKYADQQLRTAMTLPNGSGKTTIIAVLTNENNFEEAKNAGADIVGNNDLINLIGQGNINFDLLIATPEIMPKLAKLGRILGPKGLMPSPKSGTVTTTLSNTLSEFKKGKFEYKADKTGIVHVSFGKANFAEIQLIENLIATYKSIEQNRPSGVKGKYFKSIYISSSMGPSIQVDLTAFN